MSSTRKLINALKPAYIEDDKDISKLSAFTKEISSVLQREKNGGRELLQKVVDTSRKSMFGEEESQQNQIEVTGQTGNPSSASQQQQQQQSSFYETQPEGGNKKKITSSKSRLNKRYNTQSTSKKVQAKYKSKTRSNKH